MVFVSKPPIFIRHNEEGRLDSRNDYAVYWEDGNGYYYVRGVRFQDESLFIKGFKEKSIKAEQIMEIVNHEQKALLIQEYGYEFIKKALKNVKVLDTKMVQSKITGKKATYELFEYDFESTIRLRVIKVECHTTHKVTFLGVPRTLETENCMSAIAWTFGMTEEEYNLLYES
jgi:hypothetical protein